MKDYAGLFHVKHLKPNNCPITYTFPVTQHPYFVVVKHMNVAFFQKARNEKKMKI